MTGEQLLERYRDHGDQEALDELCRRYRRHTLNALRKHIYNIDAAEDGCQAGFMKLIRTRARHYHNGTPAINFLTMLALSGVREEYRRNKKRAGDVTLEKVAEPMMLDAPGHRIETRDSAHFAMRKLKDVRPKFCETILAFVEEDGSAKPVAQRLGIPEGTVKSRVWAVQQRMQEFAEKAA